MLSVINGSRVVKAKVIFKDKFIEVPNNVKVGEIYKDTQYLWRYVDRLDSSFRYQFHPAEMIDFSKEHNWPYYNTPDILSLTKFYVTPALGVHLVDFDFEVSGRERSINGLNAIYPGNGYSACQKGTPSSANLYTIQSNWAYNNHHLDFFCDADAANFLNNENGYLELHVTNDPKNIIEVWHLSPRSSDDINWEITIHRDGENSPTVQKFDHTIEIYGSAQIRLKPTTKIERGWGLSIDVYYSASCAEPTRGLESVLNRWGQNVHLLDENGTPIGGGQGSNTVSYPQFSNRYLNMAHWKFCPGFINDPNGESFAPVAQFSFDYDLKEDEAEIIIIAGLTADELNQLSPMDMGFEQWNIIGGNVFIARYSSCLEETVSLYSHREIHSFWYATIQKSHCSSCMWQELEAFLIPSESEGE